MFRPPLIENAPYRTADSRSQRKQRFSADDVWSYDSQKFTRADDLGILPEPGEMALVARHQVVCTSSVSAFNEDVVSGSDVI